jgi:soluble lytic murein transglycosylase-like protein
MSLSRRSCLLAGAAAGALPLSLLPGAAHAGAQIEEPLIDSVRNALSMAIRSSAPPKPEFSDTASRLAFLRWLGEMSERLKKKIPGHQERIEFLQTVWYESKRAGLEVSLVLGLIQVESNFRKFAVSSAGARGLMQVMPFWVKELGEPGQNLFHERTNLRYGCTILRHYLDRERGNIANALGRYNGSLGQPDYPNRVFRALREHWALEAGL